MEKICIVKRRQQSTQNEVNAIIKNDHTVNINSEEAQNDIILNNKNLPEKKIVEEYNDESGHFISITMTNEQSSVLQSSECIRDLLIGKIIDPAIYLKLGPDGRIILNFRLNESSTVRMLRFDQVCQILQISRSFLQKLVHEKTLKSYKLGRLRRFAMEDILDYLIRSEELNSYIDG